MIKIIILLHLTNKIAYAFELAIIVNRTLLQDLVEISFKSLILQSERILFLNSISLYIKRLIDVVLGVLLNIVEYWPFHNNFLYISKINFLPYLFFVYTAELYLVEWPTAICRG